MVLFFPLLFAQAVESCSFPLSLPCGERGKEQLSKIIEVVFIKIVYKNYL